MSQLSQQIQNYHPIVTCGFFTFDWTLLFAVNKHLRLSQEIDLSLIQSSSLIRFQMGAAITTYLTILLSFESPQSAKQI